MLKVHKCKFLSEWLPERVTSLSFNKTGTLLAVGRDDLIEIWDCKTHTKRSISQPKGFNVRSLAWLGDRLFSTGTQGYIHEWDINTLTEFRFYDTYGGPGLQIASNQQQTRLAVSCQDGTVNLYDALEKDLVYVGKLSSALTSPAVCLSWHPNGEQLAVGNLNSISVFGARKKEHLINIQLPPKSEVLSMVFLPDSTIAIGASDGSTQFYDGKLGTPTASFKNHKSMVLAIAATIDGKSVFSSGVDSSICFFSFDEAKKTWMYRSYQRPESRDVYALAIFGDTLVSAGLNLKVIFSSVSKFHLIGIQIGGAHETTLELLPYPQIPSSIVSLAYKSNIVLCKYPWSLELWALYNDNTVVEKEAFSFEAPSKHLLSIKISGKDPAVYSAISPCGKYVAYSTTKSTKLFNISYPGDLENKTKEMKVKTIQLPKSGFSHRMTFTADSSKLILVSYRSVITIFDISTRESQHLDKHIDENIQPVLGFDVSQDGKWLAVGDVSNRIFKYDLEKLEVTKLPNFEAQHTCLKFSPSNLLAITTVKNQLLIFDGSDLTKWTLKNSDKLVTILKECENPLKKRSMSAPLYGISFNPQNKNEVILWSSLKTIKIDLSANLDTNGLLKRKADLNKQEEKPQKTQRVERAVLLAGKALHGEKVAVEKDYYDSSIRVSSYFSGIMLLDFLDSGELVVLERSLNDMAVLLPPPFDRKIFGFS
eukprot:TRINITY_DN6923_c0_g1_i1.p1 TRINITY_DN6923_c0_g1~~TRINITY_DN6923_c0_g1_i1.p1  ORF type:complete len:738 (-),score=140.89 TRINITY_DN6923_c0_g1_i1:88-2208(-)